MEKELLEKIQHIQLREGEEDVWQWKGKHLVYYTQSYQHIYI